MPVLKLTVNGGWWQFSAPMRDNVDFTTHGALRGESKPIGQGVPFGRLPVEHRTMALCDAVFVVYSYGTPIAWKTYGVWHCPDVKYSVTTSKHQGRIFTAASELTREAVERDAAVADVLALLDTSPWDVCPAAPAWPNVPCTAVDSCARHGAA